MFASIEDSDSELDHHGEDLSSNTSADDHMSTKRTQCRLQGAGVKEVSREAVRRLKTRVSGFVQEPVIFPVSNLKF